MYINSLENSPPHRRTQIEFFPICLIFQDSSFQVMESFPVFWHRQYVLLRVVCEIAHCILTFSCIPSWEFMVNLFWLSRVFKEKTGWGLRFVALCVSAPLSTCADGGASNLKDQEIITSNHCFCGRCYLKTFLCVLEKA